MVMEVEWLEFLVQTRYGAQFIHIVVLGLAKKTQEHWCIHEFIEHLLYNNCNIKQNINLVWILRWSFFLSSALDSLPSWIERRRLRAKMTLKFKFISVYLIILIQFINISMSYNCSLGKFYQTIVEMQT